MLGIKKAPTITPVGKGVLGGILISAAFALGFQLRNRATHPVDVIESVDAEPIVNTNDKVKS